MATWCGLVLAAWFWLTSLAGANHMVLDQFGNTQGEIAPEKETLAGEIASFLQLQPDPVPPKHNLASVCHEKADMNKFKDCQESVVQVPCKYSTPLHRVLEGQRAMDVAEAVEKWHSEAEPLKANPSALKAHHLHFSRELTNKIMDDNQDFLECIRIGEAIKEFEMSDFMLNPSNGVIPLLMTYVGDTGLCCEIAQLDELKDYVTDCGDSSHSPALSKALGGVDDVYVGTALLPPSGHEVRVPSGRGGVPSLRIGSQTFQIDRQQLIEKTLTTVGATPGEHHWEDRCIFLSVHLDVGASEVFLAVATDVSAVVEPQYAIRIFTLFEQKAGRPTVPLASADSKLHLEPSSRYEHKIFVGNIGEDQVAVFDHIGELFADRNRPSEKGSLLQRERYVGAGINGLANFIGQAHGVTRVVTWPLIIAGSIVSVVELGLFGVIFGGSEVKERGKLLGKQWQNWAKGEFDS